MVRPGCVHCAQVACALRRVVARCVPCRRQRRSCRRPPLGLIAAMLRVVSPCPRAYLCAPCRSSYAVSQHNVVVSRPKVAPPPPPATIQTFVSRPCSQPSALRAVSGARPVVLWASWPYCGRAAAVSWPAVPCRGVPLALPPSLAYPCCVTIQSAVS